MACSGRETTEKIRIIARHQQVVRADFETDDAVDGAVRARIYARAALAVDPHAAWSSPTTGRVWWWSRIPRRGERVALPGKPVLVDPHIPHFAWYRGVTVITPNSREAHHSAGIDFRKGNDPAERPSTWCSGWSWTRSW